MVDWGSSSCRCFVIWLELAHSVQVEHSSWWSVLKMIDFSWVVKMHFRVVVCAVWKAIVCLSSDGLAEMAKQLVRSCMSVCLCIARKAQIITAAHKDLGAWESRRCHWTFHRQSPTQRLGCIGIQTLSLNIPQTITHTFPQFAPAKHHHPWVACVLLLVCCAIRTPKMQYENPCHRLVNMIFWMLRYYMVLRSWILSVFYASLSVFYVLRW